METVKIMPCLDMRAGRVVKGVKFVDIKDVGDPAECCRSYCEAGADEIALLDITATLEGRATMLEVVRKVSAVVTIPFTVGGGISDLASAKAVIAAGANKVSTSSAAFKNPDVIGEMVEALGADKVTVAIDALRNDSMKSGYEVYINGGTTATGADAVEWAKRVADYGAKTILPTSKSTDGVRCGFDLPLISMIKEATGATVVASGGAGNMEHFLEAAKAGATILLGASVFHYNIVQIPALKAYLKENGVPVL